MNSFVFDQSLRTLALAWLAYGLAHSLLASFWFKHQVQSMAPVVMPAYRLAFNAIALIGLIPVGIAHMSASATPLWIWEDGLGWLMAAIAAMGLLGLFFSFRCYDSGEFSGIAQWRNRREQIQDEEGFTISVFHRFVRHPWYSLSLLIIWTRDMDSALLVSVSMITLYFWLGSILEEKKLIDLYGERYVEYQRRVPGLIPRPWRYLTAQQAENLLEKSF